MSERPARKARRPQRLELQFLEALRRRCPAHEPILEALGHLYTRVGRYADGLQIDLELTRLCPREPDNWYNLACSYALLEDTRKSMAALDRAVELGYANVDWMKRDPDLKSLHALLEFHDLVKRLSGQARWEPRP